MPLSNSPPYSTACALGCSLPRPSVLLSSALRSLTLLLMLICLLKGCFLPAHTRPEISPQLPCDCPHHEPHHTFFSIPTWSSCLFQGPTLRPPPRVGGTVSQRAKRRLILGMTVLGEPGSSRLQSSLRRLLCNSGKPSVLSKPRFPICKMGF